MKQPKTHTKWNILKDGTVKPQPITQKTADKHFKRMAEFNKPREHVNCRCSVINLLEDK